jgi:hypothetical protein
MNILRHSDKKYLTYERHSIEIDLQGPEGNAFHLLGVAKRLAEQLGKDQTAILEEMQSGDYEHLLEVFDREFGDQVTLYK